MKKRKPKRKACINKNTRTIHVLPLLILLRKTGNLTLPPARDPDLKKENALAEALKRFCTFIAHRTLTPRKTERRLNG